MHRLSIFLLVFVSITAVSHGQADREALENIRQWYVETESRLGQCTVYEDMRWNSPGDPAGYMADVTGYFDKDEDDWIKIIESGSSDNHRVRTEYLLKDGTLFYMFATGVHPAEGNDDPGFTHFEKRIYFSYGEVVKFLFKEIDTVYMDGAVDFNSTGSSKGDPAELDAISFIDRLSKLKSALK